MLKKLAATAAVLGALMSFGSVAEAKTNVTIGVGIGTPGCYGYACDYYAPGWQPGYGFYDGPRYRREPIFMRDMVTCKDARWILIQDGWRNVRPRDCRGAFYTFTGVRGRVPAVVRINSLTGRVISVRRLR